MVKQTKPIKTRTRRNAVPQPASNNPIRIAPMAGNFIISSEYNDQRSYGRHGGVDLAPREGSGYIPALAVNAGRVLGTYSPNDFAANDSRRDYGNYVDVQFDNGLIGRYAHLDSFAVTPGQTVNAGDTLGDVGNTGASSGRHLHFELRESLARGGSIDPIGFLRQLASQTAEAIPQIISDQPVRNVMSHQLPPEGLSVVRTPVNNKRRLKVPTLTAQETPDGGDYPPGMAGTVNPPSQTREERYPPRSLIEQVWDYINSISIFNQPGVRLTNPETGEPYDDASDTGAPPDFLEVLTGMNGDEREAYIQEKAPYLVIAIIAVILLILGVARVVFAPQGLPAIPQPKGQ